MRIALKVSFIWNNPCSPDLQLCLVLGKLGNSTTCFTVQPSLANISESLGGVGEPFPPGKWAWRDVPCPGETVVSHPTVLANSGWDTWLSLLNAGCVTWTCPGETVVSHYALHSWCDGHPSLLSAGGVIWTCPRETMVSHYAFRTQDEAAGRHS